MHGWGRFDTADLKRELLLQDQVRYGNLRLRLAAQAARVPVYVTTPGAISPGAGRRAVNWDLGALYRLSSSASVYAGSQYAIESDIIRAVGSAIFQGSGEPTPHAAGPGWLEAGPDGGPVGPHAGGVPHRADQCVELAAVGSPGNSGDFFITPRRVVDGLEIDLAGRPWPALDVQLGFGYMRANDLLPTTPGVSGPDIYVPAGAIPARSMHILSRYALPERWMPNTPAGLAARARSSSFAIPPSPLLSGRPARASRRGAAGPLAGAPVRALDAERLRAQRLRPPDLRDPVQPGYIPLEPRRSFGLTATYRAQGMRP